MKAVTTILAATVFYAFPAIARANLPRDMLGLWADSLESCRNAASDGRMTIEPQWVEFAALGIKVRRWERRGSSWRGIGRMGEEGEGTTRSGSITLRLLPDGRMQVDEAAEKRIYLRCADAARRVR